MVKFIYGKQIKSFRNADGDWKSYVSDKEVFVALDHISSIHTFRDEMPDHYAYTLILKNKNPFGPGFERISLVTKRDLYSLLQPVD